MCRIRETIGSGAQKRVDIVLAYAFTFVSRSVEYLVFLALIALYLFFGGGVLGIFRTDCGGKTSDAAFDMLKCLNDLEDSLPGDILERAGLEDIHHLG